MSFLDYALEQIIDKNNLLLKVDKIVNWNKVSGLLDKKLGKDRDTAVVGRIPYKHLSLFKVLLLQQWHNLSDPKMEEALKTRIDFMWFSNFGLATNDFMVPDETTICRFRNKLIKHKLLDKLLKLVNTGLEENSLKVKICNGAILDATLIESSVNSRAKPNLIVEDRNENNDDNDNSSNSKVSNTNKLLKANEQNDIEIDKDAKWLKKGKDTVFGYKNFVITDATDGYIETVDVTPANTSEVTHLEDVLSTIQNNQNIKVLFTDKGYTSKKNSDLLQSKGIGNGIMDKAFRNTPLTKKQKNRNKRISKTRYIVERTNATTAVRFNFKRTKYIGIAKVKAQALLVAMAHNLLKAANKIKLINSFTRITLPKICDFGLFA